MAGLSLRTGVSAGANYTPMTPAAASIPSSSNGAIGQQAFGITGSGVDTQRNIAGYGSVAVGAAALIAMVYIWWSLPR